MGSAHLQLTSKYRKGFASFFPSQNQPEAAASPRHEGERSQREDALGGNNDSRQRDGDPEPAPRNPPSSLTMGFLRTLNAKGALAKMTLKRKKA